MSVNGITSGSEAYSAYAAASAKSATATTTDTEKKTNTTADAGAIYEPSKETAAASAKKTYKPDTATIAKMKADADARTEQLRSLVEKMMTKQGVAIGTADSMWSFLAKGDFTVDEATRAQAQADIADDGYWGVDQTSDRILDFAKALSGNDPEKADLLLDAFKKGFKEATKSWGQDLPDISQRTYDAVVEKFNKWKNGTEETEAAQTQA